MTDLRGFRCPHTRADSLKDLERSTGGRANPALSAVRLPVVGIDVLLYNFDSILHACPC